MNFPRLGVVIVTYNSSNVIIDCLESLLAARGVQLTIVIVDNGSTDDTLLLLQRWAVGESHMLLSPDIPFRLTPSKKPIAFLRPDSPLPQESLNHHIVLVETGLNGGFAAGVNHGLAYLAAQKGIDRFWVLNPDSVVPPETPEAFATAPAPSGGFSLMGGRVLYLSTPDVIQIDGGTINWRTGVTSNVNLGASHAATPPADPAAFDFITGASLVASRAFYESAGPLCEDYFLYYEEVDWAMRRGNLPLAHCAKAIVYHRTGTSIGSATLERPASAFSTYFKFRSRHLFIKKFRPSRLPSTITWSLLKSIQLYFKGRSEEAAAILNVALNLEPPSSVQRDIVQNKAVLIKVIEKKK